MKQLYEVNPVAIAKEAESYPVIYTFLSTLLRKPGDADTNNMLETRIGT